MSSNLQRDQLSQMETTCGSLLYELQMIWNEVGESDADRDRMLLELEQECLEVYRRKVDKANRSRTQLRQAIADSEADLAAICSCLGERPVHLRQSDQNIGSLKAELRAILPQLEEMRKRKTERLNEFLEVLAQIKKISFEIFNSSEFDSLKLDEADLSTRKLDELRIKLQELQNEKNNRLMIVLDHLKTLNSMCLVLGMDFKHKINEIHPSLDDSEGLKNISNDTIEKLATSIERLREIKLQRMQKLQDLATTMIELWNLMDTPMEEQQMFQNVTCNIAASEHEITEPNTLSVDFINYIEAEISRLEELKASKMKDLILKKKSELEEICRKSHMVVEADTAIEFAVEAIDSGSVDPGCILEQIEIQIVKAKEESFSRKDILERVEKWLLACDEECWLEEYNRDDNRYNASRGAHLTLKRAEKARAAVNKLPAMVDGLASRTLAWEKEKGFEFTYDGVRLLSMLEEYTILRQERENERRRQRDQKKLQGQLIAEQEVLFGSKPSPSKPLSAKKGSRNSMGGANRRLSLGGAMIQPHRLDFPPKSSNTNAVISRTMKKGERISQNNTMNHQQDDVPIDGLSVKKNSFNSTNIHESENPLSRQPFSPIVNLNSFNRQTNTPSKQFTTSVNAEDDRAKTIPHHGTLISTPVKQVIIPNEEGNRTPKVQIPVPTTLTVSVPMQTAMTPAPSISSLYRTEVSKLDEEIEYSFEERRATLWFQKHIESPCTLTS